MIIWIVFGALAILSFVASKRVESKFKKYSKIAMNYGMTGREVAEKMLYDNDIHNVTIHEVNGTLTDHYNPVNRTLNLSHDVYHGTSVAAAAVAAHECGHAVQHATAYSWLSLRSTLVPMVNFSNKFVSWVLLAGILLVSKFPGLLLAGIILFAITTLFSLVTLPVEINASKRALLWLNTHDITSADTHPYAESALRSAAYTYVVAALTSLATLCYYVLIYLDRR
ncbi:MAG: zinc metallopeptidase [Bacteroidales bacterium]|nr:zinc metallopeptidase [Candidatus Colimorpha pelethequi]